MFTFRGHSEWVRYIRVHPDGSHFASCGIDQVDHIFKFTAVFLRVLSFGRLQINL